MVAEIIPLGVFGGDHCHGSGVGLDGEAAVADLGDGAPEVLAGPDAGEGPGKQQKTFVPPLDRDDFRHRYQLRRQRVVIVGVLETNPGLALFICRYRGNRQTIHDHRIERAWDEAFGVGLELLMAGCLHFHFCHPCCVAAGHVQEGDLLFIRSVAFRVTYDGESSLECRVEVRAVNSRRFEQFSKR